MLETKLADDPVYQDYRDKFDRLELVKEKLNSEMLTTSERKKLLDEKKELETEVYSAQEKLRNKI